MSNGEMLYKKEDLIKLAEDIRLSQGRLKETHDELTGYVNQLVATWEGQAQAAYRDKQARWDDAQNDLMTTLGAIAKVVEDGVIDMDGADKSAAQAWL